MTQPKFLILLALLLTCRAAQGYDVPGFTPDQIVSYKQTVNGSNAAVTLKLHVFTPPGHQTTDKSPAIVFFFGGGWVDGSPTQFHPHCEYLASRGMVAISAEYRVKNQHGTSPQECVRDGKSAIRYVRQNAAALGIDPNRIAAGGGSAGGQVAAATGTLAGYEEAGENLAVSAKPDALVLFNPVFDNGPQGFGYATVQSYWEGFSPLHNIGPTAPPTIVFLGTNDALIPVATAQNYKSLMEAAGRRCDLFLYPGQEHGFFNFDVPGDSSGPFTGYPDTVAKTDGFLVSIGYLVEVPAAPSVGPITYIDAVEGVSGNTFATGGSLAQTSWVVAGGATTNSTQWVKRTDAEGNGVALLQVLPGASAAAIPELTTEIPGLPDGEYEVWAFYWDQVVNDTQNWILSAGLTSGRLTTYSSPGEPAVAGAITTGVSNAADLTFSKSAPRFVSSDTLRNLFGVRLGRKTVSGGSVIRVHVDMLPDVSSDGTRVWYDGVGYARVTGGGNETGARVLGIDFNRNDTLGAPSQSLFRAISGSATQAANAASYTKKIDAAQVTITQPSGEKFEFRGGNGDGSRAIPGGDASRSFLVADFIATRKGAIDLTITGLPAGNYVFRSHHLDPFTASGLGFAQGATTTTPNIIEARIGVVIKANVQPTSLGVNGLNTTFINDAQIPTLSFPFTHAGSSPLVITLRSTRPNGADNFLLLNGFEILNAAP